MNSVNGVGLGFRFGFAEELLKKVQSPIDFLEIAPENYLYTGGFRSRLLAMAKERWPIVCHGLCGDFAASSSLNIELLNDLKLFLQAMNAKWYSDHLCFTQLDGRQLHDLIPLPFNERSVRRVSKRIRQVQEIIEMPIAIENVSAYARMPGSEMEEIDFLKAIVFDADCYLLLDVNNVYVNSKNFKFDAKEYIDALPLERVIQIHIAGHYKDKIRLIDTHGSPVIEPVFELLHYTLKRMPKEAPILLERDNNIPSLTELENELIQIQKMLRRG